MVERGRERERFNTLKICLSWPMVNEQSDCMDVVRICIRPEIFY